MTKFVKFIAFPSFGSASSNAKVHACRTRIALPFLILSLVLHATRLIGQNTFEIRYGTEFEEYANKAIQTQNGNFIVGGTTRGFGSVSNAFLTELDPTGGPVWARNYPGINSDEIFDILEHDNNGLIVCGGTHSYGVGYTDGFVMHTDGAGNMVWGRTYGNEFGDFLVKIEEDGAGGYFTAGYTQLPPLSPYQPGTMLMRLDSLGEVLWSEWLPDAWQPQGGGWYPIDLLTTATGDVLLTAVHGGYTVDLWKFTSAGTLLWSKTFGQESQGHRMVVDEDDNIYITCYRPLEAGNYSIEVSVLKLDPNGNVLWCNSYGDTYFEFARALTVCNDGGIAIAGYTNSSGHGAYDAFALRLDPNGGVLWARTYGTVWDDMPNTIEPTADGGFIMAGQTYSYGSNPDSLKIYVVKTDGNGNTACSSLPWSPQAQPDSLSLETPIIFPEPYLLQVDTLLWPADVVAFGPAAICSGASIQELQNNALQVAVHPNPFNDRVVVTAKDHSEGEPLQICVRDILGRVVYETDEPIAFHAGKGELDLGRLQSGVFTLELLSGDGKGTLKLIKQ